MAIVAASSVSRGSVRPSSKLGGAPANISWRVTATAYRSAWRSQRGARIRQKWVEIWPRSSSDRLDWRARKREVKENQAIRTGPGDLRDTNVVQLYVAMGDAFLAE
jgi:hypothetical protein